MTFRSERRRHSVLRSYTVTCRFRFEHDEEEAHCTAQLLYQDLHLTVIRFQSDITCLNPEPVIYSLNEYDGKYWVANLNECISVFIDDPMNVEYTAVDLLELDGMKDDKAEELAAVLSFFYVQGIPRNPSDFEDKKPYLEDDTLPF